MQKNFMASFHQKNTLLIHINELHIHVRAQEHTVNLINIRKIFKLLQFCKKKSYKLGLVLKHEAFTFQVYRSFYFKMFLHYTTDGKVKTLFFTKNTINFS